eukprot:TRINITY_DN18051_c2_g1_i1.p2 TRINITY_DN18051_c2_g1~~TRINITY_DN18051_c2_g1_i1.p2  ORF type:complete len:107 (+),score=4.51 TRINITY_DN18051_c2_g1_i1:127-447(+)
MGYFQSAFEKIGHLVRTFFWPFFSLLVIGAECTMRMRPFFSLAAFALKMRNLFKTKQTKIFSLNSGQMVNFEYMTQILVKLQHFNLITINLSIFTLNQYKIRFFLG